MTHKEAYEKIVALFERQKDMHPLSQAYISIEKKATSIYEKFIKNKCN